MLQETEVCSCSACQALGSGVTGKGWKPERMWWGDTGGWTPSKCQAVPAELLSEVPVTLSLS